MRQIKNGTASFHILYISLLANCPVIERCLGRAPRAVEVPSCCVDTGDVQLIHNGG
jgi:hypothetical protein